MVSILFFFLSFFLSLLILGLPTCWFKSILHSYSLDDVYSWCFLAKSFEFSRSLGKLSCICSLTTILQSFLEWQANGSTLGRCGANMDTDPSPSNVKMLIGIAEEMLKQKNVESVLFGGKRIGEESNFEKLDWFAGELVLEHQRRSCRIAPTVAFKQATPKST